MDYIEKLLIKELKKAILDEFETTDLVYVEPKTIDAYDPSGVTHSQIALFLSNIHSARWIKNTNHYLTDQKQETPSELLTYPI